MPPDDNMRYPIFKLAAIVSLLIPTVGDSGEDVFAKARKEITPQKDFRVVMRYVGLTRHVGIGGSRCMVILDTTWDKRLSPLVFQQGAVSVTFAKDASGKSFNQEMPAQSALSLAGRDHREFTIQVAAPHRSSPQIDILKGQLIVTTPSKLLNFTFDSLKGDRPVKKTMEGVSVTLDKVTAGLDRISVEVIIDNPKGTPTFETFQTSEWVEYNSISVEKGEGSLKQMLKRSESDAELLDPLTPLRARIRYHFALPGKSSFGKLEDWRLLYRTPGPIVEVSVPFELKNIPLP